MNTNANTVVKNNGRELLLRTVSGIAMAAFALFVTWIGGALFVVMWACLLGLAMYEFFRICGIQLAHPFVLASLLAYAAVPAFWLWGNEFLAVSIAILTILIFGLSEMLMFRRITVSSGLAYATLPFLALVSLRGADQSGLVIILLLYACVWGTDVFAYFAGRTFGGPKLAPAISPKKTWSGFAGGIVGALVLAMIVEKWAGYDINLTFIGILILLSVTSQLGDLLESYIKRKFDVKDSGTIIPGHGGILDRIDGLIIAAVVMAGIAWIVRWNGEGSLTAAQSFINAFMLP